MRFLALAATALISATALSAPAEARRPIAFAAQAPQAGALVIPVGSAQDLAVRAPNLDAGSRDAITRALTAAEFDYSARSTLTLRGIGPWSRIVLIGTGTAPLDVPALHTIGGVAARETGSENGPVYLLANGLAGDPGEIALGTRLGGYSFDRYRSQDPARPRNPGRDAPLTIVTNAPGADANWRSRSEALAQGVYFARDLGTEPANIIYPESFVERTREAFRGVGNVTIQAYDVPQMERLGMGGMLSVGMGSARPPRLMIVEYRGPGASGQPIVLAGKGITFDSGGTSIKPAANMWQMKNDMAGAAAVTGTVLALARQRAPVHVVAVAALAENMPGGAAARPGDVVRAYNGKTIERHNTDAEGRIVLADAVSYAERRFRPAAIVDVATLTGSVAAALGGDFAGLFSRHEALAQQIETSARATGEAVWRLPLHPRYGEAMRSDIADIVDVTSAAPGGGVGAHFIGAFITPTTPWAHLDIAGIDWADSSTPTVPEGASGYSVRLLEHFVRNFRPVPPTPSSN